MPVQLSYPGVYVEEVPSGVRTITGVATSVAAFVGRAPRGTTSGPVTVTSYGDFERVYGGLWKGSTLGYAVRDFFLNGGSTAVIVRLYRQDCTKPTKAALSIGTGAAKLSLLAVDEGTWGNGLRARVDTNTRPLEPDEVAGSLFNLFVRDGTTGVVEEHRNVVVAPADHPRLVTRVLANESRLVTAAAIGTNPPPASSDAVDPGKTVWDDNTTATNAKVSGASDTASDGVALTDDEFTGAGKEAAKT